MNVAQHGNRRSSSWRVGKSRLYSTRRAPKAKRANTKPLYLAGSEQASLLAIMQTWYGGKPLTIAGTDRVISIGAVFENHYSRIVILNHRGQEIILRYGDTTPKQS